VFILQSHLEKAELYVTRSAQQSKLEEEETVKIGLLPFKGEKKIFYFYSNS
jgi:hypothetical protein